MKNLKFIIIGIAGLIFSACTKDDVVTPEFDVSIEKETYGVGDTVSFKIRGDADLLTFYSGEEGREYQYKDRTEYSGGKLTLSMNTQVLYGSQQGNLKLLCSTDFNGIYDAENLKAASWTDISSRFTWANAAAGAVGVRTESGLVDISDIIEEGKPLYFAFKYVGDANTDKSMRTWRIYNFDLTNQVSATSNLSIATRANAGWIAVDFANPANVWTLNNTTMIYFTPASSLIYTEDWAVSGALFPNKVAPDIGLPVKSILDEMKDYQYTFTKAGEYKVTFVAANANQLTMASKIKELNIIVK